jgi:hypothetical protein
MSAFHTLRTAIDRASFALMKAVSTTARTLVGLSAILAIVWLAQWARYSSQPEAAGFARLIFCSLAIMVMAAAVWAWAKRRD